jgi:hypothetical protein
MLFSCRCFIAGLVLISTQLFALSDKAYLPADTEYLKSIPTPTDILGAPVGEWHVRHDQLVTYMRAVAASSERVSLVETGRTHENRPLLLLAFTSAQNQKNLAQIQANHLANLGRKNLDNTPLILWMGYSVHGDEPSGSNAALLIAYYLAAGQNAQIDALLQDNVVLLDPSINPDGLARFAQWANMHRGKNLVSDPNHREHQQSWPSGRTNHYWFDLNRDWLLLTHPESRARVAQYQAWRPDVLTDFHEMGPNSSFFFQPGIPSRKNPWTPLENVALTEALGQFHAKALDADKQLYFTQESYDDFYYGKGSTYPDAHGSIGILFEQASSRGHQQQTVNGLLKFSDTIQNQVTTSLSTFSGALANKQALLNYRQSFVEQTQKLIGDDDLVGYVISEAVDKSRFAAMQAILNQHRIQFWPLAKAMEINDHKFNPLDSIFVPLEQAQYRLIKSLFSVRQRFDDNTFYDVSNWNLPLAFNLLFEPVKRNIWRKVAVDKVSRDKHLASLVLEEDAYAYAFSWLDSNAPKLLQRLLSAGVKVKVAGSAFVATTPQGDITLTAGSVIIPTTRKQPDNLLALLGNEGNDMNIKVWSVLSGLTRQGIDLGSREMRDLASPHVLLIGGAGTSQYEVGEIWHYLDQRVDMPITITDLAKLDVLSLAPYSHIIWASGDYHQVLPTTASKIEHWIEAGGVIIGQGSAAKWFSEQDWLKASFLSKDEIHNVFSVTGLHYADQDALAAKQRIAGAVFDTRLDLSHPLTFGFPREHLPSFRNSTVIMRKPKAPFITVGQYTSQPLLAGYTADELQQLIANSASVVAHTLGKGKVIAFADNPNFRGYWYGTSRLLSNAIFMADFINSPG